MTGTATEPTITLPTRRLVVMALAIPAAVAVAWSVVAILLGSAPEIVTAGLAGSAITAVAALSGTLIISPWRPRLVGDWMNMWLAATVVRMMVAPGLAFLLYSATPLPATPFAMAVGLSYLTTLFGEAGVLSRYLHRVLPEPQTR